jgi:hypothetical protein
MTSEPTELYHYTTKEYAREVLGDLDLAYADVWEGVYGTGLYALDLGPNDATREELRRACFDDSRQDHPMDGVLIFDTGLAAPPFEYCARHIWIQESTDKTHREFIGHIVSGVGVWTDSGWHIEEL